MRPTLLARWLLALASQLSVAGCQAPGAEASLTATQGPHPSPAVSQAPHGRAELVAQPPSNPRRVSPDATPAGTTSPETAHEEPALTGPERAARDLARRPPVDGAPRLYAKSRNVWIRGRPTSKTQWIGFLWFGSSVKLREPNPIVGHGCKTWYAIEPRGYVCVDGKKATLDPDDPELRAVFPFSPNAAEPTPHAFYGESIGAERYHHPPSERQMRAREWDFRLHRQRIETALAGGTLHESLLGIELALPQSTPLLLEKLPHGMQEGHKQLIPRSAVAWTKEFTHEGRAMVLADDMTWVPKDRIRIYDPVDFEGVHLNDDVKLPLAFFRAKDRPKYAKRDATFVDTGEVYPRLSWTPLTEERVKVDEKEFVRARDGSWLDVSDAVIPTPRAETPWGAPLYQKDETGKAPKGRHTWIQASILGGWLVAFEGTRPVFATLMSPGKGGAPHGNIPTLQTASTPTGWFKITGKFVTSTMIAPNDLAHSAVPWAQNFKGPYALHGAYWHDDFGQPMSGGCVNVSPKDGRFLFEFTEPRVPEGWHGVRWLPDQEGATGLILAR